VVCACARTHVKEKHRNDEQGKQSQQRWRTIPAWQYLVAKRSDAIEGDADSEERHTNHLAAEAECTVVLRKAYSTVQ
jgi:hypothetical protein